MARTAAEARAPSNTDLRKARREARELRNALATLSGTVRSYLVLLDRAMKQPDDGRRGRRIAELSNALEYANDLIRFGTLREDFRKSSDATPALIEQAIGEAYRCQVLAREAAKMEKVE